MKIKIKQVAFALLAIFFSACQDDSELPIPNQPEDDLPPIDSPNEQDSSVYTLPVVVHVLHNGESVGNGSNLSNERILRQVEILNEDFRRKEGTLGFNQHPDSDDAKIEFVLASQDPNGDCSNGVVRKEFIPNDLPDDIPNTEFERYAFFSYWPSDRYINIWIAPYPDDLANILLGQATGPDSDLPGDHLFQKPLQGGAEGIVINWAHFGESNVGGNYDLGRTLTHEMGHYLGLLHTWGTQQCETNDYCDDTPAVDQPVKSGQTYLGCEGEEVMVANYMNFTPDAVMNVFTKDQIYRMRYVLENSTRRKSLLD